MSTTQTILEQLRTPPETRPGAIQSDDLSVRWVESQMFSDDVAMAFDETSMQVSRALLIPRAALWRTLLGLNPKPQSYLVVEFRHQGRRLVLAAPAPNAVLAGLPRLDQPQAFFCDRVALLQLVQTARAGGAQVARFIDSSPQNTWDGSVVGRRTYTSAVTTLIGVALISVGIWLLVSNYRGKDAFIYFVFGLAPTLAVIRALLLKQLHVGAWVLTSIFGFMLVVVLGNLLLDGTTQGWDPRGFMAIGVCTTQLGWIATFDVFRGASRLQADAFNVTATSLMGLRNQTVSVSNPSGIRQLVGSWHCKWIDPAVRQRILHASASRHFVETLQVETGPPTTNHIWLRIPGTSRRTKITLGLLAVAPMLALGSAEDPLNDFRAKTLLGLFVVFGVIALLRREAIYFDVETRMLWLRTRWLVSPTSDAVWARHFVQFSAGVLVTGSAQIVSIQGGGFRLDTGSSGPLANRLSRLVWNADKSTRDQIWAAIRTPSEANTHGSE